MLEPILMRRYYITIGYKTIQANINTVINFLLKTGKIEIGLMFLKAIEPPNLKIGVIRACFKHSGYKPEEKHSLIVTRRI